MSEVKQILGMLLIALSGLCNAADLSNYPAAVEYIRCLATTYDLQNIAKAELASTKDSTSTLMTTVRASTRANLEMRSMIASLNQLEVSEDASSFVRYLADFYQQKIDLNEALIEIASKMLSGPKPGVDYGKLMTSTAQISATVEQVDVQIFKLANAFFAVMIDMRPDKEGHTSHLKITKSQRVKLLELIDVRFGRSLDRPEKNSTVNGAWLMRSNLKKGFKASDEPW